MGSDANGAGWNTGFNRMFTGYYLSSPVRVRRFVPLKTHDFKGFRLGFYMDFDRIARNLV